MLDQSTRPSGVMPGTPTIARPQWSWRRALPLLGWVACLVAAITLLLLVGNGRLDAPALTAPGTWPDWAAQRDPFEVVMVVLRLVGLGLSWYLLGVTTISVLARALRLARLVRLADALSFGPVRILAQQALGLGLAAGVLAGAMPATPASSAGTDQPTAAVQTQSSADGRADPIGASVLPAAQSSEEEQREVLAPIPAPEASAAEDPVATTPSASASSSEDDPTATPAADEAPTPDPSDTTAEREVRVEPGDHFWALAERDVEVHLGRDGTESEVAAHWQRVVDANADRLTVPGNPDLLLPGQRVLLPAVEGVGS